MVLGAMQDSAAALAITAAKTHAGMTFVARPPDKPGGGIRRRAAAVKR